MDHAIKTSPTTEDILHVVEKSLDDDKAKDLVVIDLAGKTSLADYMVVATGQSSRQVGAMADHLLRKLKKLGLGSVPVEGQASCDWVLVDAGDVIIHLFRPEVREFYDIEKLWQVDTRPSNEARAHSG